MNKSIIIAEVGINHNGSLDIAKRLIERAKESGADYVKFQTFDVDKLATSSAPAARYQRTSASALLRQRDLLRPLQLTHGEFEELKAFSDREEIKFLSTGFDIDSVRFLLGLGIDYIKIPSGDITDYPLLQFVSHQGHKVLLSTGMSTMNDIENAMAVLTSGNITQDDIIVLHCTSTYPAPFDDVNLSAMVSIRNRFGVKVGYSDHTVGICIGPAAVALGACVIEKHLTLSRALPGPDHSASLEPCEFKEMVGAIRSIERSLGNGEKCPQASEMANITIARKSIVASRKILKGDVFCADNLTTKRPGDGRSPMEWTSIIGSRAESNYVPDEQINK